MKFLFCLPYAGGSGAIYYKWNSLLSDTIQLCPIELKGRGKRINEVFYEDINEAVNDIYIQLKDKIDEHEYAIFGHSMGSRLAHKLYYKIDNMNNCKPKHIFFSGYGAPNISKRKSMIHSLPDPIFIQKIMEMGGTPEEFVTNKDLQKLCLPILRNDFRILERDQYTEKEQKLDCDISILSGDQDTLSSEAIGSWENYTDKQCKMYMFEGNHFFINHYADEITAIINHTLGE